LKRRDNSDAVAKRRRLPAGTKHYIIDFVYADNGQQFGTEADLTDAERYKIETYLECREGKGEITDAHLRESGSPVHQGFAELKAELAGALQGTPHRNF
jgi:hypothetical protein